LFISNKEIANHQILLHYTILNKEQKYQVNTIQNLSY